MRENVGKMTFHVDSEVGVLKQVIVHRPGLELTRLTPSNVDELLFDDVMWAQRAREEHDAFVQKLRDKGVKVHLFDQLLAQALDQPGAREFLQDELTTATRFGPALDEPLDELVASAPAERLAEALIGGVLKRDLDLRRPSSLLLEYLEPDDFLLRPLPNHLFQRDNSAWVYDGLSVNPMSKPARKRETINSRVVWNFHPMFRGADPPLHFYYGNDSDVARPGQLRGRRHPRDRQRRGDGRHGRAHHPAGRRVPRPAVLRPRHGDQGHRRRAAEDPRVHAPRHRDDHDRPRRVQRVSRTCPRRCGRSR